MLPIGSIVVLNNGSQKIMIINRGALYNNNGTVGYFDYSACLYPFGQTEQTVFFFNEEDIREVVFEGYRDMEEIAFCEQYEKRIKEIAYPRLSLKFEEA